MIYFFEKSSDTYFAVGAEKALADSDLAKLKWLFSGAELSTATSITGSFIGPRKEMISPWSTNAVEIAENCGLVGLFRIEVFMSSSDKYDPMLQHQYEVLDQGIFSLDHQPEPIQYIEDLEWYNEREGLALNPEEISFLKEVSSSIGRALTDSEIFGFSQVNSEHCRHKIFNGEFIIDEESQELTLFQWIKKTSKENPNLIVSAYKDNVAFIEGPSIEQFSPVTQDKPDYFETKDFDSVLSLKAETHNFPTTVEPFNGAATGSGGEIRDRMAGGQGSIPLAGTAVYMTSYPRSAQGRVWEQRQARKWLYQTPMEILIKASNGASDYGNKFGQPLISGSLLTFEHETTEQSYGYDKVIMMAGGIGLGKKKESKKLPVKPNQKVVILGGDNYRIG
ncbi:MAG: phosphoribosylformylglycinamidine synthase, partial [Cyclobacteriaceae bacterium]|nr:phosphoribosylformylglycinamidine synthase [Cyclobacteriaceae bacterium HetDA_MAG_MS6]